MNRCIIVGGGLIGMLTARELHSAGVNVVVLDSGLLGHESSWAGGGIVSPLYPWRYPDAVSELARYSQQAYPELIKELLEQTGIDPEFCKSGLLVLDHGEQQEAAAWCMKWNAGLQRLRGRQALQDCEPALSDIYDQGLLLSEIAQLRNPRIVKALRESLRRLGIECHEGVKVSSLVVRGQQIAGVETQTGFLEAERVVIAAGAWSAGLLKPYGIELEIAPVKGQMILLKGEPGMVRHIILSEGRYLIPRQDGRILAGSTLEHCGFDQKISKSAREELRQAAITMAPALEKLDIEHHWAGLRPGTPKGIPYIGSCSGIEGLYVNAGHFRNGVGLGPASARLLTDIMMQRPPIVDPRAYSISASH